MAITLDGTNGITTPDVDSDGLTVDTNTLFVDAANNRVGVGTSSPAHKISVLSAGGAGNYNLHSTASSIVNPNSTGSEIVGAQVAIGNNIILSERQVNGAFSDRTDLAFVTDTGFGLGKSDKMRLDAAGNLLVGATATQNDNRLYVQSSNFVVGINGTNATGESVRFYNNGTTVGTIAYGASSVAYNTTSDYRLKEDVQPMVGATDRLMALKPVNFAWKVDGTRVDGFLAHEAQEVVPECVTGQKDQVQIVEIKDEDGNVTGTEEQPVYQGIDQSKIVPLLTAALQEALTKIEALEARVVALETNV